MIVTLSEIDLLVLVFYARADWRPLRKIERRALHRGHLAGGDLGLIHGRELLRVDHHFMTQNVAGSGSREIKIGVIR